MDVSTTLVPDPQNQAGKAAEGTLPMRLAAEMRRQSQAQAMQSHAHSQEMSRALDRARMKMAVFQAERTLSNTESSRAMAKLANRFSLISKIQQNLG